MIPQGLRDEIAQIVLGFDHRYHEIEAADLILSLPTIQDALARLEELRVFNEVVEQKARALCECDGLDPDEEIIATSTDTMHMAEGLGMGWAAMSVRVPRWMTRRNEAAFPEVEALDRELGKKLGHTT